MNKTEDGLYVARVAEGDVKMMHADEDTVCDAETQQMFAERNVATEKAAANAEKKKLEDTQRLAKLAAKAEKEKREAEMLIRRQKRRRNYMVKDAVGLLIAGAMVLATYRWGLLVAVACTTACAMGAACRVVSYVASVRGGDL